jgi:hypothetical protein
MMQMRTHRLPPDTTHALQKKKPETECPVKVKITPLCSKSFKSIHLGTNFLISISTGGVSIQADESSGKGVVNPTSFYTCSCCSSQSCDSDWPLAVNGVCPEKRMTLYDVVEWRFWEPFLGDYELSSRFIQGINCSVVPHCSVVPPKWHLVSMLGLGLPLSEGLGFVISWKFHKCPLLL